MLAVLYFDKNEEKELKREYTETLRNNGIAVIPIETDNTSVACPGCEYSLECEQWEYDGWCIISKEGEHKKISEKEIHSQGPEKKEVNGHLYIKFEEHPNSDSEGFVQAAKLIVELAVNKLAENTQAPADPPFYYDETLKGYFLRNDYKVVFLDGDKKNLDISNLDVSPSMQARDTEIWVIHPGSSAVQ